MLRSPCFLFLLSTSWSTHTTFFHCGPCLSWVGVLTCRQMLTGSYTSQCEQQQIRSAGNYNPFTVGYSQCSSYGTKSIKDFSVFYCLTGQYNVFLVLLTTIPHIEKYWSPLALTYSAMSWKRASAAVMQAWHHWTSVQTPLLPSLALRIWPPK